MGLVMWFVSGFYMTQFIQYTQSVRNTITAVIQCSQPERGVRNCKHLNMANTMISDGLVTRKHVDCEQILMFHSSSYSHPRRKYTLLCHFVQIIIYLSYLSSQTYRTFA